MSCFWVGKEGGRLWGGRLGGAWCAHLLPTEGRSVGSSTFVSFFCAPLSLCLSSQSSFWLMLWWSSSLGICMLNRYFIIIHRCFNAIVCVCRKGLSGGFPAGLRLVFVTSARDSFGHGKWLPIFYRGLMCMCCVSVCTQTHTLMWGKWMWTLVLGQDTWRVWKKSRCTVVIVYIYTMRTWWCGVRNTHVYIYAGLQVKVCTNCPFVFF